MNVTDKQASHLHGWPESTSPSHTWTLSAQTCCVAGWQRQILSIILRVASGHARHGACL